MKDLVKEAGDLMIVHLHGCTVSRSHCCGPETVLARVQLVCHAVLAVLLRSVV